jgi:hypothetical protein
MNQNEPKSEGQEHPPFLLKPENSPTRGGCHAWGDDRARAQTGGSGPFVCGWVGRVVT